MNGLSIILYVSDIVGNIGPALVIFGLIGFVVIAGFVITGGVQRDFSGSRESDEWKEGKSLQSKALNSAWIPVAMIVIATLIPSKQTVLLIGASQAGEQILQLEEVKKIGGEAGALASDTISMLREMISEQSGEKK